MAYPNNLIPRLNMIVWSFGPLDCRMDSPDLHTSLQFERKASNTCGEWILWTNGKTVSPITNISISILTKKKSTYRFCYYSCLKLTKLLWLFVWRFNRLIPMVIMLVISILIATTLAEISEGAITVCKITEVCPEAFGLTISGVHLGVRRRKVRSSTPLPFVTILNFVDKEKRLRKVHAISFP